MYNEAPQVTDTLQTLVPYLRGLDLSFEIIVVDDGSSDDCGAKVSSLAMPEVRLLTEPHRGRGGALRSGFNASQGVWVVCFDFDLSYSPDQIHNVLAPLQGEGGVDCVLGSCYMEGGRVEDVSASRLLPSKVGNWILRQAFFGFHTMTCVFRAYKGDSIRALTLTSDDKQIHLEILARGIDAGWRFAEVPAFLKGLRVGASKTKMGGNIRTHLIFALSRRPALVMWFLWLGLILSSLVMVLLGFRAFPHLMAYCTSVLVFGVSAYGADILFSKPVPVMYDNSCQ